MARFSAGPMWFISFYKEEGWLPRIVCFEDLHAVFEEGVLVILDEGGADAEAFLFGAAGDEADG